MRVKINITMQYTEIFSFPSADGQKLEEVKVGVFVWRKQLKPVFDD